jgi:hypothetical protein
MQRLRTGSLAAVIAAPGVARAATASGGRQRVTPTVRPGGAEMTNA